MNEENDNIFYTPVVDEKNAGIRIDKFIAQSVDELSRSMVQKLIEKGEVFADEEIIADK